MNSRTVCCSIISSCQSAAISKIVKCSGACVHRLVVLCQAPDRFTFTIPLVFLGASISLVLLTFHLHVWLFSCELAAAEHGWSCHLLPVPWCRCAVVQFLDETLFSSPSRLQWQFCTWCVVVACLMHSVCALFIVIVMCLCHVLNESAFAVQLMPVVYCSRQWAIAITNCMHHVTKKKYVGAKRFFAQEWRSVSGCQRVKIRLHWFDNNRSQSRNQWNLLLFYFCHNGFCQAYVRSLMSSETVLCTVYRSQ